MVNSYSHTEYAEMRYITAVHTLIFVSYTYTIIGIESSAVSIC